MPKNHAKTSRIRAIQQACGVKYHEAATIHADPRADAIVDLIESEHVYPSYAAAVAWLEDPANQEMCETCGWTYSMICPECSPGCGCSVGCSGWRHAEATGWTDTDDDDDSYDAPCAPACGCSNPYCDVCGACGEYAGACRCDIEVELFSGATVTL